MGENKERMLRGEPYVADDPELLADFHRARLLVERFNATSATESDEGRRLLEKLLGRFGAGSRIRAPFQCEYGYLSEVGERTFINYGAVILDCAKVTIGDEVQIATNVQLLTATHPLEPAARRADWESAQPIGLEDGVWLGGGVIVCPGVTIGENTVVGAGGVVVKDLPPGVLAVGNPARPVRDA
jgi:maltose O-acetyltransferase